MGEGRTGLAAIDLLFDAYYIKDGGNLYARISRKDDCIWKFELQCVHQEIHAFLRWEAEDVNRELARDFLERLYSHRSSPLDLWPRRKIGRVRGGIGRSHI